MPTDADLALPTGGSVTPKETEVGPEGRSLSMRFAKGVAWTAGAKWLVQMVSLPATIWTAKVLRPEDYGYVAVVSVFFRLAQLCTEAGIGAAVVSGVPLTEPQLRRLNSIAALLGVAGFLSLAAIAVPVSRFYHDAKLASVLIVLGAALILEGAAVIPAAKLRRRLRFKELAISEMLRSLTDVSVTLGLALQGWGYWSLPCGYLAGLVVWLCSVSAWEFTRFSIPRNNGDLHGVMALSRDLIKRNLASFLANGSDTLIGGIFLSKAEIGRYSFAVSLACGPADKITQLIMRVAPAILSTLRDRPEEMRRQYLQTTALIAAVAAPLFIGLALVSSDIVPVLLSDKWAGLARALVPLCVGGLLIEMMALSPHVLVTLGRTRMLVLSAYGAIVLYPALYWMLARRGGADSLATAWAVGGVLTALPVTLAAAKSLEISVLAYWRAIRPAMLALSGMTAGVLVTQVSMGTAYTHLPRLIASICVGAVVYIALFVISDRERARSMMVAALKLRSPRTAESA